MFRKKGSREGSSEATGPRSCPAPPVCEGRAPGSTPLPSAFMGRAPDNRGPQLTQDYGVGRAEVRGRDVSLS